LSQYLHKEVEVVFRIEQNVVEVDLTELLPGSSSRWEHVRATWQLYRAHPITGETFYICLQLYEKILSIFL
jgi:hypothetical protein